MAKVRRRLISVSYLDKGIPPFYDTIRDIKDNNSIGDTPLKKFPIYYTGFSNACKRRRQKIPPFRRDSFLRLKRCTFANSHGPLDKIHNTIQTGPSQSLIGPCFTFSRPFAKVHFFKGSVIPLREKNRIPYIDLLRCVAACFVIAIHCLAPY